MTPDEFDSLLSRFEDASVALHVEQTRSVQERWEAVGDAIRAEFDRFRGVLSAIAGSVDSARADAFGAEVVLR